ncbi:hypothetical protein E3N88_01636 [Mikania micrantha]|uniref:Uncharacterized protein n=1 Tax=Mikania micrantha TaxID=192012 RepID=A0A5N6Q489_9ASTR|nr:hypothetical protein E3N88_01636 [Mikania micrantha]
MREAKRCSSRWRPRWWFRWSSFLLEFEATYDELFNDLESELAQKGKAFFNDADEQAALRFLGRAYLSNNPEETMIGKDGPKLISTWVLFNLGPLLRLGLLWFDVFAGRRREEKGWIELTNLPITWMGHLRFWCNITEGIYTVD